MVLTAVIFYILLVFLQLCSQANVGTFRIAFTVRYRIRKLGYDYQYD